MVNCVLKKRNKRPEEAVIVGDRLYTDIKTGERAGVDTICVLDVYKRQRWDVPEPLPALPQDSLYR